MHASCDCQRFLPRLLLLLLLLLLLHNGIVQQSSGVAAGRKTAVLEGTYMYIEARAKWCIDPCHGVKRRFTVNMSLIEKHERKAEQGLSEVPSVERKKGTYARMDGLKNHTYTYTPTGAGSPRKSRH
ncbi:hypothetical protein F4775DRAFT_575819 [Biscogniauxia sp. FL1348]|nr:hypothetical protein F4775DRAFT_575819 [Biscogniauxia sp. FL1348]